MRIVLTKTTERSHRFEVVRDDGRREAAELETRSLLLHDMLHYAFESCAGLNAGFYGRLAGGDSLASLSHPNPDEPGMHAADSGTAPKHTGDDAALATIEQLVGALTPFAKGEVSAERFLRHCTLLEHSGSFTRPDWLDAALLARVHERLRRLLGHWKALRHGQSLELPWPAA